MRLFGPSKIGNALIIIGLLLLLYVPISYGWTDIQGMMLRAQLNSELKSGGGTLPEDDSTAATGMPGSPAGVAANPILPPIDTPTVAPTATSEPSMPSATAVGPVQAARSGSSTATLLSKPTVLPSPTATKAAAPTATPLPAAAPVPPAGQAPAASSAPVSPGGPVRMVFPDLRIDAKVTTMDWKDVQQADGTRASEWQVPEYTIGWAVNSAPPGVPGNVVLSGHNNIYNMVFRNISLAWPENAKQEVNPSVYSSGILNNRLIELYSADGQRFTYRVTGFYRLHDSGVTLEQRQQNADYMQPTSDSELTLITCWPPWSNTYRLVVRAKLVQP